MQISHNKTFYYGKNNIMKNKKTKNNCQIHVMPPTITDTDISALFNGLLNVVKKKFELDNQAEFLNMNNNMQNLVRELKEKQAEINRLKNEILHLKSLLAKN